MEMSWNTEPFEDMSWIGWDQARKLHYGYFNLYFLLFKATKSDMKIPQKIVSNLINENIFPSEVSSLSSKTR